MQETSNRHELWIQTKYTRETIQTIGLSESVTYGVCNLEVHPNRKNWYSWEYGICKWKTCAC